MVSLSLSLSLCFCIFARVYLLYLRKWMWFAFVAAVAQNVHDKEEAREEDEAEQAYPSLDPHEDRQHHQVLFTSLTSKLSCCFSNWFYDQLSLTHKIIFFFEWIACRYNAKRRHWRRTKLGFWKPVLQLHFQVVFFIAFRRIWFEVLNVFLIC